MAIKCEVPEGYEIRGFRFRVYPTAEQVAKIVEIQETQRLVWNWLVSRQDEVTRARGDYAIRSGKVGPRPTRPDYDGVSTDMTRDDRNDTLKALRKAYGEAIREWSALVYKETKDDPVCAYRSIKDFCAQFGVKQDYQLFNKVASWMERPALHASIFQALGKSWHSKGVKRKRRSASEMPVRTRTGECFGIGNFGSRGKNETFYNCQIKIAGLKIRGRLPGKTPVGRVIEGVSLTQEPDGWFAAVREVVPVRVEPVAIPGTVIGLDVGLDNIVAMSNGEKIPYNARLLGRIRALQERVSETETRGGDATDVKEQLYRRQTQYARWAKDTLYSVMLNSLAHVETIVVEKLHARIGQMSGSRKPSQMRMVVSMLKSRLGDHRVREVAPHYTSQDCSRCGIRSKESWSYTHGRFGKCPSCGHIEDRDINAARNIARKYAEPLAA